MRRLVANVVAVAVFAATACKKEPPPPPAPALSAEQKQHIKKLVDDASDQARDLDATRLDIVSGPSPTKAEPSSDACPFDGKKLLPPPPPADATKNARLAFNAKLLSATLTVADVVDPNGEPQRSLKPAMTALDAVLEPFKDLRFSGALDGRTPEKAVADLEKAIGAWRDAGDGLLVQKKRVEAVLEGTTFTGGRVAGRFYFIARKDKRVMCLADVDVEGPRGFSAWGETQADVAKNASRQLPARLTGEAIIEGLVSMRAAK